jgi:hypothetical protein
MSILIGLALAITLAFLVLYVTWLFATRIRANQPIAKSFLRWLRDLFDLVSGL